MIKHYVDTKRKSVSEIFEEAQYFCLPTIQRQFVWDEDNIKKLIDSISRQYPIGAIIVWRPSCEFPNVPLVDVQEEPSNSNNENYIIDGQQRLTALLLIINDWKIKRAGKSIETDPIKYIPESKKLRIGGRGGIDIAVIVKASSGNHAALNELQNGAYAHVYKKYRKDIEDLGKKIVKYPVPFYILESKFAKEDYERIYEEIAEIFTRVNSEGVKLGRLEMFLSFFAGAFSKETINVKDKITEMDEKHGSKYALDLEPILRFVFSNMGRNQNEITNIRRFSKTIEKLKDDYAGKEHQMNRIVNRCDTAVGIVMELIAEETGIETTKYIPSQNALIPLFQYIYNRSYKKLSEVTSTVRKKLIKWFLIASFNGIYSGSPNPKIERDLKIVNARQKRFSLRNLLNAMLEQRGIETDTIEKNDVRKAYADAYRGGDSKYYMMLLTTLLHRNEATNWEGNRVRFSETPIRNTARIHHIFSQEELMKEDPEDDEYRKKYVNNLANLTLISGDVNSSIGSRLPEDYLPEYVDELSSHLIPQDAKLWTIDRFEDFLEARLKLIWNSTKELLDNLG